MISQQDRTFLEHAVKSLPKDGNLTENFSSDPFIAQLQKMKADKIALQEKKKDVKPDKGVTAGAHLADTGHGLKPTLPKGAKEETEKEGEVVTEKIGPMDPKKKGMWKGKTKAAIAKAKSSAKKSGNVKREREANFALVAKAHFKKGAVKKESEDFNENQPEFAHSSEKLAGQAYQKGWGKRTLGATRVNPEGSSGGAAEQGHGKKAIQGSLERKEETALDESTRKHFREVANTVRAIEDPKKRQEFADHHAGIFASQNPRFDAARFHEAAGTLHRNEDVEMNEDGDAKGQGTHPTGKETLGAVRIKADGSPGEAAAQGHGKKPVTGEICRDGHPGSPSQGETEQGHGKKPIRGEICREDVHELVAQILDDKPGEALEAFSKAIHPLIAAYGASEKDRIRSSIIGGAETVAENADDTDETEVEVDSAEEKKVLEAFDAWFGEKEVDELSDELVDEFAAETELDDAGKARLLANLKKLG